MTHNVKMQVHDVHDPNCSHRIGSILHPVVQIEDPDRACSRNLTTVVLEFTGKERADEAPSGNACSHEITIKSRHVGKPVFVDDTKNEHGEAALVHCS